ncbi:hypothetical protein ES703_57789 [subsurface metagenome]
MGKGVSGEGKRKRRGIPVLYLHPRKVDGFPIQPGAGCRLKSTKSESQISKTPGKSRSWKLTHSSRRKMNQPNMNQTIKESTRAKNYCGAQESFFQMRLDSLHLSPLNENLLYHTLF